ncbi:MAG: hypothetical protein ACYC0V_11900 [Armatimonadota bacterium]
MSVNNAVDNIESKIEMVNRIYIGVALLTVVALFIKPISNVMPMPKPMPGNTFDLMFIGLLAMSIFELFSTRIVVWQGLKKIATGNLSPEWPATYTGLVYSIGFGSMFPFIAAIALYHLMGNTQMHAIIIAGVGGLNYINYLALAAKIKEAAEKISV